MSARNASRARDPLHHTGLDVGPLVLGDEPRHEVQREDPLLVGRRERDALLQEAARPGGATLVEICARHQREGLVQRLGVGVRRTVGIDHLVVGVAAVAGQEPIHAALPSRPVLRRDFVTFPKRSCATMVRCERGRQVRVGCEFVYDAAFETAAVFQIEPHEEGPGIVQRLEWRIEPNALRHGYRDMYGNGCQRVTLPVGRSTLRFDALIEVPDATEAVDLDAAETPADQLPDDSLVYTLPSRYVLPDVLAEEAWQLPGRSRRL